jgi:hypothetical protein
MKSINIVNEYIDYTRKSIKKILKITLKKYYNEEIFNEFFNDYVEIRYFDMGPHIKKNTFSNIEYNLYEKSRKFKTRNYDYLTISSLPIYVNIFLADCCNIKANVLANGLYEDRKEYLKLEDIDFYNEVISVYNEYKSKRVEFIEQFKDKKFNCDYYQTNIRKVYNTSLSYNIKFPKLYSSYAISNVYNSEVIYEDMLFIQYYLVICRMFEEIISLDYTNNYIVSFSTSLFSKEDKILRLLNLIDNDICKEKISLTIDYKSFIDNKSKIISMINEGYNFAIIIPKEQTEIDIEFIRSIFKYIIISIDSIYYNDFNVYSNVIKVK